MPVNIIHNHEINKIILQFDEKRIFDVESG